MVKPTLPISTSPESHWRQVMIAKRSETGELLRNAQGKVIERPRILDTRTGKFYRVVPLEALVMQLSLLPISLPIWTLGQMTWSAGRCVVDVPCIAFRALQQLGEDWQKGVKTEKLADDFLKKISGDLYERIGTNVLHFVKAPFFAGAMVLSAASAVTSGEFIPWEARKRLADVEYLWQEKISFKEDVRWQGADARAFYLYWCHQPRGDINRGLHFVSQRKKISNNK